MRIPQSIKNLSKEQLEEFCINLLHTNDFQVKRANTLEDSLKEFRSWIDNEIFRYQTGWCTQDMDTTIRVGVEINMLQKVSKKLEEIEKKNNCEIE